MLRTSAHFRVLPNYSRGQQVGLAFRVCARVFDVCGKEFSMRSGAQRFLPKLGRAAPRSFAAQAMIAQWLALLPCDRARDVRAKSFARSLFRGARGIRAD